MMLLLQNKTDENVSFNLNNLIFSKINDKKFNDCVVNELNINILDLNNIKNDCNNFKRIVDDTSFYGNNLNLFEHDDKLRTYLKQEKIEPIELFNFNESKGLYEQIATTFFCRSKNCYEKVIPFSYYKKIFSKYDNIHFKLITLDSVWQKIKKIRKLKPDLTDLRNKYQRNIFFKLTDYYYSRNHPLLTISCCEKCFDKYLIKNNLDKKIFMSNVVNYDLDFYKRELNLMKNSNYKDLKSKIFDFIGKKNIKLKNNSSEKQIWESEWFKCIPLYWDSFEVEKIIFGKEQGKFNGPDFVFKSNKKLIGFEVFWLNKNSDSLNLNINNLEKYNNSILKSLGKNLYLSYDEKFKKCISKINEKVKKWNKFFKTDQKWIGILLNGEDTDSNDYFRLQIELNNIYNKKDFNILIL